uniref:Uncharacterized protein n=1 Tax=Strongyloides papillosus TaxID=174720 RepID=A0A0N5B5N7_STREA
MSEVKQAKIIAKPIDELIDKESLSMKLQLAYAMFGENKSSSEDEEEPSKESGEGVPKLAKYDSTTSQSWNGVFFWNLPKYFLFLNGFPFHEKFICNEDRTFLKEMREMHFDSMIKYLKMDIIKDNEDDIISHLESPHCSYTCDEENMPSTLKEQITSNLLYIPKSLRRKVVKKV